jgi:hypothetical protein
VALEVNLIPSQDPQFKRLAPRAFHGVGLSSTLRRLSRRRPVSRWVARGHLLPFQLAGYLQSLGLDASRISEAVALPLDPLSATSEQLPTIDALIPCGPRDVELLPRVVDGIRVGSSNPIGRVSVIAPTSSVAEVGRRLDLSVNVIDEHDILPTSLSQSIAERFPSRASWVLQQVLKVAAVVNSDALGVLVVDADTILIHPRTWLTREGVQVLTPTIEWHEPYYSFLTKLPNGHLASPSHSFVPHHMVMQPKIMGAILESMTFNNVGALVESLGTESDFSSPSMFCIEYELYAQGLLHLRPELVSLAKWSNVSMPRNSEELGPSCLDFMSVSEHHYLGGFTKPRNRVQPRLTWARR